jgi:hypothetical protein
MREPSIQVEADRDTCLHAQPANPNTETSDDKSGYLFRKREMHEGLHSRPSYFDRLVCTCHGCIVRSPPKPLRHIGLSVELGFRCRAVVDRVVVIRWAVAAGKYGTIDMIRFRGGENVGMPHQVDLIGWD